MAAIGRKGAGKTYLSQMIAEQMLDNKDPIVVIDPVGVWWGLRVAADGKSKGKQIFVIGGQHGDVPLVPEAGARIAQLVVEKEISVVIDVSEFRIGERKRFCQDFGEEFFQLKKRKRTPVCLYLEEAQLIVPQNIRPEEGRMYSAYEQIVRLGRNYGIGCMLITQRPQSVNKEVLSQIECLFVLQITGPHERKAIEYWVQEAGADRTLVGELPGLARGEGYVWSPSWLKTFQRVHFSKKQTFDASATPEVGKKTRATFLSAVDVKALEADMADVVKKAQEDDPIALKRRIAELERAKPAGEMAPMGVSQWANYGKERGYWDYFMKQADAAFERERAQYRAAFTKISLNLQKIQEAAKFPGMASDLSERTLKIAVPAPKVPEVVKPDSLAGLKYDVEVQVEPGSKKWGPGELKILTAIYQHQGGITREHLTILTGYKKSSRDTYIKRLAQAGLVETGPKITATPAAAAEVGDLPPVPERGPELVAHLMQTLPPGEAKILDALLKASHGIERETLTEITGYQKSSRDTYIKRLAARQLIEKEGSVIKASDILF